MIWQSFVAISAVANDISLLFVNITLGKKSKKFSVANGVLVCMPARTNFSHWKRNGCRQQKPHRKRTKTINNAGRFERIVFLLFLSSHFFFSPSILHPFTWLHKVSYFWWYTERLLTHSHSIIFLYIAKFRLTSMRTDVRLRLKRNRWKSRKIEQEKNIKETVVVSIQNYFSRGQKAWKSIDFFYVPHLFLALFSLNYQIK